MDLASCLTAHLADVLTRGLTVGFADTCLASCLTAYLADELAATYLAGILTRELAGLLTRELACALTRELAGLLTCYETCGLARLLTGELALHLAGILADYLTRVLALGLAVLFAPRLLALNLTPDLADGFTSELAGPYLADGLASCHAVLAHVLTGGFADEPRALYVIYEAEQSRELRTYLISRR